MAALFAVGVIAGPGGSAGKAQKRTLYVSPNGPGSACTKAAPCDTFNRAYRVAQPGDVVLVAAGSYPQQDIDNDPSKTSSTDVVFRPEGGVVTIGCRNGGGCIDISGSHITFDGGPSKAFRVQTYSAHGFSYQGRTDTERGATDITFRRMDIGAVAIGSSYTTISDNDLGPSTDPFNIFFAEEADHLLIEHNLIHDFVIENGGHFECMYWDGPDYVTMRDNEFRSCAIFGVHAKEGPHYHELIENNVFWNPRGITTNYDLQFTTEANPCGDVTIRYNTFTDGLWDDCWPTAVYGNIFRGRDDGGRGYHDNIANGPDSTFVSAAAGDFHLRPGSKAVGAGDPSHYPATDKDGHPRPQGRRPDAGAYELGPTPIWGIAPTARSARGLTVEWLRQRQLHGSTSVVLRAGTLGAALSRRVSSRARAAGLHVLVARSFSHKPRCTSASPCMVSARTVRAARRLALKAGYTVVVRVSGPGKIPSLQGSRHGRIVAVVRLSRPASLSSWRRAIDIARTDWTIDLAVAPGAGSAGASALAVYEQALDGK